MLTVKAQRDIIIGMMTGLTTPLTESDLVVPNNSLKKFVIVTVQSEDQLLTRKAHYNRNGKVFMIKDMMGPAGNFISYNETHLSYQNDDLSRIITIGDRTRQGNIKDVWTMLDTHILNINDCNRNSIFYDQLTDTWVAKYTHRDDETITTYMYYKFVSDTKLQISEGGELVDVVIFDSQNRMISCIDPKNVVPHVFDWMYDANGNLSCQKYMGNVVKDFLYQYSPKGLIRAMVINSYYNNEVTTKKYLYSYA